ncbi:hypothetical protein Ancab_037167 [Ancistrocladus abbreviatus]
MAQRILTLMPLTIALLLLLSLAIPSHADSSCCHRLKKFVVGEVGKRRFRTINEAVNAASKVPGNEKIVIHVKKGMYEETVNVDRPNIELVGDGIGHTIISCSLSATNGLKTFHTATFAINGNAIGFIARGITFRNNAGGGVTPAVALRSSANYTAFYHCSFEGYQDTLYAHQGWQFYRNCVISGTVDFIFGNAAAVFQNSKIYIRNPPPGVSNVSFITAHGRATEENTGFVFQHCRVTSEPGSDLVRIPRTYLGRPWKTHARVVFMETYLDNLIDPAGWSRWNDNDPPHTIYFAEYMNEGPGAVTTGRVNWPGYHWVKDEEEISQFTIKNFLMRPAQTEWLKASRIPYTDGP